MQIKGRRWNMRQPQRRRSPLKIIILLAIAAFLVYVNITIEPLSPSLFLPSPTPTTSPETYIAEAEEMAAEGKYTLALQAYEKAIKSSPQDPSNYIAAARLNLYASDYESAIENASNAVLLDQNNSMGAAIQGFALGMQGNYLEGESALNRAIELDPSNSAAYAYLSIMLYNKIFIGDEVLGDLDKAIEASRTAASISENSAEALWARGSILSITGNYEEAIALLEQATAINSNIAEIHLTLGTNYRTIGEYDKAVEEYTRANALNPSDPNPDTLISRTYSGIGEFSRAIQYAEQAVRDAPDDPYLYGNLGSMYYQNYEYESAIMTLKLAVRGGLTPEGVRVDGLPLAYGRVTEYYYNYAFALSDLGYCEEAINIAQSIIQSVSDDLDAVYNANVIIERCYEKLNDLQLLKLPEPTMFPTWTPQPSPTPTPAPTVEPTATLLP